MKNNSQQFYIDPQLAAHFGVPYSGEGKLIVALSTLRRARPWDADHERLWAAHQQDTVVGVRRAQDAPGWFELMSV